MSATVKGEGRWAEIGAFFAGALLGGIAMGEAMKVETPPPTAEAPVTRAACPVMADVVAWGHVDPEDVPEGGVTGFLLASDDPDAARALGMGIWLKPGPMEMRQR